MFYFSFSGRPEGVLNGQVYSSIAGCLAQLKEAGVAKGTNGYYYPANSINRAEFFTLAIRAYVSTLDEEEKAPPNAGPFFIYIFPVCGQF